MLLCCRNIEGQRRFCHEIDHLNGEMYMDKTEDGVHDVTYDDLEDDYPDEEDGL